MSWIHTTDTPAEQDRGAEWRATSTGDERAMDDGWRQAAAVKLAPERPVPLVCLCPCQAPRFWVLDCYLPAAAVAE